MALSQPVARTQLPSGDPSAGSRGGSRGRCAHRRVCVAEVTLTPFPHLLHLGHHPVSAHRSQPRPALWASPGCRQSCRWPMDVRVAPGAPSEAAAVCALREPRRLSRVQLVCGSSQAELLVAGRALTCLRIWLEYRFARAFGVRPETPLPNRPRHAWGGVRAQCWVAVLQTRQVAVPVRDAPAVWASGA